MYAVKYLKTNLKLIVYYDGMYSVYGKNITNQFNPQVYNEPSIIYSLGDIMTLKWNRVHIGKSPDEYNTWFKYSNYI